MQGPVITVDVSKSSCHYQPYVSNGHPMRKPKVLHDTVEGFQSLSDLIDTMKDRYECETIPVIFEATGVYHRCLQKYLDDHQIPYYIISPLMSASYRKTTPNSNKTDDLDCSHIAKAYYGECNLFPYDKPSKSFHNLRELNRYYECELNHLRMRKNTFRKYLDIVYPRLDKCFKGHSSLYDEIPMEVIKQYPHPSLLLKHKEETIVKKIEKKTSHNASFIQNIVHEMYECSMHCYSGADVTDVESMILPELVDDLQSQEERCDEILKQLVSEAQKTPYFTSIVSIVGIGDNLAARIIAELGDMSRFSCRRAITAYAGLNPKIRQSGDMDGIHLAISKKGNKHLRCLMYLAVSCNYRLKKCDVLYEFNQKKRQQSFSPLKPKAAIIATAHKLLLIIYALCTNGTVYHS